MALSAAESCSVDVQHILSAKPFWLANPRMHVLVFFICLAAGTLVTRVVDVAAGVLAQAGIQTQVCYPEPLHQQRCFVGNQELPEEPVNIDAVVPSVLSLPISPGLKDSTRRTVVLAIKESGAEAIR